MSALQAANSAASSKATGADSVMVAAGEEGKGISGKRVNNIVERGEASSGTHKGGC